jgi:hypothetical protein
MSSSPNFFQELEAITGLYNAKRQWVRPHSFIIDTEASTDETHNFLATSMIDCGW